jgi:hypothetical protein
MAPAKGLFLFSRSLARVVAQDIGQQLTNANKWVK